MQETLSPARRSCCCCLPVVAPAAGSPRSLAVALAGRHSFLPAVDQVTPKIKDM